MALTLPTLESLNSYRANGDANVIQRAADLFTVATGISDTPIDPLEARLVEHAILDMSWYLQVRHDDLEAEFSPFSSERIGSYSYSKMTAAAANGTDTGVPGFDAAVAYFAAKTNADLFAVNTEWVFTKGHAGHLQRDPEQPYWDRPTPYTLDGGRIELDEYGNPILEIEE